MKWLYDLPNTTLTQKFFVVAIFEITVTVKEKLPNFLKYFLNLNGFVDMKYPFLINSSGYSAKTVA